MTPSGIHTSGIGKVTTSHLNTSRTMADVWRDEAEAIEAAKFRVLPPRSHEERCESARDGWQTRREKIKHQYAGAE